MRTLDCSREVTFARQQQVGAPYNPALQVYAKHVDLREFCPRVYDQGWLGACTGFAVAKGLIEIQRRRLKLYAPEMSALYLYYHERLIEENRDRDVGATIVDAMWVAMTRGCASVNTDPYKVERFRSPPSDEAEKDASKYKIVRALHLHTLDEVRHALTQGNPVAFGMDVFSSMLTHQVGRVGRIPMPEPGEKVEGGHAVCAVGFDDREKHLIVRNSWGGDWGDRGYFYLPFSYVKPYTGDFWTALVV